jgi:hypothetical protein
MLTDKGNEDIAAGFINDLFNVVVKVTPLVPYDVQAIYDAAKESKLIKTEVDFLCETYAGERFIIELQVAEQQNFNARALYYLCSRFCSTYNMRGFAYDDLKAVKMMCLLGFSRNLENEYNKDDKPYRIERYTLQNEKGKEYAAKLLDLRFFEYNQPNLEGRLGYISKFLLSGKIESDFPVYLQKAAKVVEYINLSEKEKRTMEMFQTLEERMKESNIDAVMKVLELIDKGYSPRQAAEIVLQKKTEDDCV